LEKKRQERETREPARSSTQSDLASI
ncbi:hypothetical protein PI124_g22520, partial [Phytophthora idaei]